MSRATFERLSTEGRAAILEGAHRVEEPPVDGSLRWGLSMILRPDAAVAEVLDGLTASVVAIVGGGHWATASSGAAHLTIRGLEPHRVPIPAGDPFAERCASALRRAARDNGAVRFDLAGLLVTPISVMLRATPCDDRAATLWSAVDREVGEDGGHEAAFTRDIWYLNLVHFAGPIARPAELNEWVDARARLRIGEITVERADLVVWEFDGRRMVPTVLAEASLVEESAPTAKIVDRA